MTRLSVVRVAGFGVVLAACASGASRRPGSATPTTQGRDADAGASVPIDAGADLPTLDALAARGNAAIARMHELARVADAATRPVELEPARMDACFRAIVAATATVVARFEDEAHVARGESSNASLALVPPRGPACARKGERLRLVVERAERVGGDGPSVAARAVIWQAP